jgi:hypothetical protein
MTNLNGAFGVIMGPGYLTKYLDMLSVDLSQKVIHFWGSHKKAEQIKCAVGPLGLLAPFVHLGAIKNHPCDVQSIGQLGLNTPDSK